MSKTAGNYWQALGTGRVSRRTALRSAALGAMGLGAAALVGCGGDDEPSSPGTSGTATGGGGSTATATASASSIKRGGLARVGHAEARAWDQDLDPQGTLAVGTPIMEVFTNTYRHLVNWTQGAYEVEGELAESWESPESGVWVFKLRPGVKFHGGEDFTSEDVAFHMERNRSDDLAHPYASWLDSVGEVETPDDMTVIYRQSFPFLGLLGVLASARTGGIPSKSFTLANNNDLKSAFNGTGPWKVKERKVDESVEFERFEGYFRQGADGTALPYLDRLMYIKMVEEASRVAAIRAGEIENTDVSSASADLLESDGNITLTKQLSGVPTNWSLHVRRAPTDDIRVRQALNMSINRPDLINKVPRRGALTMTIPHSGLPDYGIKPEDMPAHYREPNLAEARKLLEAAGHADGLKISRGEDGNPADAEVIREHWAQIGVELEIVQYPPGTYKPRDLDYPHHVYLGPAGPYPDPDMYIYNFYHSSRDYARKPALNDTVLDGMLEKARVMTDLEERKVAYRDIQLYLDETAPILPLYDREAVQATRSDLADYLAHPQGRQDIPMQVAWLDV